MNQSTSTISIHWICGERVHTLADWDNPDDTIKASTYHGDYLDTGLKVSEFSGDVRWAARRALEWLRNPPRPEREPGKRKRRRKKS